MRTLIPLPDRDFDTTEVAVPWRLLTERGNEIVFATQRGGRQPQCDPRLLTGVLFGKLGAEPEPIAFYRQMTEDPAFRSPVSWSRLEPGEFDSLLLPGGHAPGMRQYLEDADLQRKVAALWALDRPVAAICHGVIVLARTSEGTSGKLGEPPSAAAASLEDAWARREELLFERLAVRWEIAGLPLSDQAMLLGRYRMADPETQRWVRETIAGHLQRHIPELA